MLAKLPKEAWHGGEIQRVRTSVIHLMRGQIYSIQGKTFFTMGGASSHDTSGGILEPDDPEFRRKRRRLESSGALYRVNHRSWWAAELPSEEEYQTAQANLERHGWAVEYIITHCCPTSVLDAIGRGMFQSDPLTDFLEEVAQRCRFRHWFFWHYHMDGHMGEQFIYLYQELLQIDADP